MHGMDSFPGLRDLFRAMEMLAEHLSMPTHSKWLDIVYGAIYELKRLRGEDE